LRYMSCKRLCHLWIKRCNKDLCILDISSCTVCASSWSGTSTNKAQVRYNVSFSSIFSFELSESRVLVQFCLVVFPLGSCHWSVCSSSSSLARAPCSVVRARQGDVVCTGTKQIRLIQADSFVQIPSDRIGKSKKRRYGFSSSDGSFSLSHARYQALVSLGWAWRWTAHYRDIVMMVFPHGFLVG
jgi:hypothetical protein